MEKIVDIFDNPCPERDYQIMNVCQEFTSVCPVTGQPDFGTLTITYHPAGKCIELKSLKLYLQTFRNQGVYYERVVNRILDDLVGACQPRSMHIEGKFTVRGGIYTVVTAEYRQA